MTVRCSAELRLALEVEASKEGRSRERQILHILENYMRHKGKKAHQQEKPTEGIGPTLATERRTDVADHKRTRRTTTYRVSDSTLTMIEQLHQTFPSRYRTRTQVVEIAVEELYRQHLAAGRITPAKED
jgi:hypothetical protein